MQPDAGGVALREPVGAGGDAAQCAVPRTGDDDGSRGLICHFPNDAGAEEPEQIYHGGRAAHHGAARADYAVEDSCVPLVASGKAERWRN